MRTDYLRKSKRSRDVYFVVLYIHIYMFFFINKYRKG